MAGINTGKIISRSADLTLRDLSTGTYTAGVYNFGRDSLTHGVVAAHSADTVMDSSGQNAVVHLEYAGLITRDLATSSFLDMIKGVK